MVLTISNNVKHCTVKPPPQAYAALLLHFNGPSL